MSKAVGAIRGGTHTVRDLLRPCGRVLGRRRVRHVELVGSPEPQMEGVIYLTPDGDGYILYANRLTATAAAAG